MVPFCFPSRQLTVTPARGATKDAPARAAASLVTCLLLARRKRRALCVINMLNDTVLSVVMDDGRNAFPKKVWTVEQEEQATGAFEIMTA